MDVPTHNLHAALIGLTLVMPCGVYQVPTVASDPLYVASDIR